MGYLPALYKKTCGIHADSHGSVGLSFTVKYRAKKPSTSSLRGQALRAQALTGRHKFGRGIDKVKAILEHLGYIQIDTISVVERAHNHTMWSRTNEFDKQTFNTLVQKGEAFEYWSHAASYLPMRDYQFSQRAKNRRRLKTSQDAQAKRRRTHVLHRIRDEGPLSSRDFVEPRRKHTGWWDWKPAKRALETLYMQGDLMVSKRIGFTKYYDLPERLVPSDTPISEPKLADLASHLVETTLDAHGFAELRTFLRSRNDVELRQGIVDTLTQRIDRKQLFRFESNGLSLYAKPSIMEATRVNTQKVHILSPFDNSVIHRERARAIFDYDYKLECYVPEKKRVWGYFSLPILYGDQFVGRMDCKAHRKEKRFEIKTLHMEKKVNENFFVNFRDAIQRYAIFCDCDFVTATVRTPKNIQELFEKFTG